MGLDGIETHLGAVWAKTGITVLMGLVIYLLVCCREQINKAGKWSEMMKSLMMKGRRV